MERIRVLLVDDHKLVRAGIRALLENLDGVEVVAEAGNAHEALRLIKSKQPDLALVEIALPGKTGIELAVQALRECPQVRILILSLRTNDEHVLPALRAGVAGYLAKDADAAELERAVNTVSRGEIYLSPHVSPAVLPALSPAISPAISHDVVLDHLTRNRSQNKSLELLTPRQREVLKLIGEANSTKEIAHILKISVKTVETHRAEIMTRLEVGSLAGLVRYAINTGLVSLDQ